jgi:competence protein ComEA
MKPAWQMAFGLVGGLLAAGVLFLITRPPRGEPVILNPPPTPAPIMVHVTGAVVRTGVVSLPAGSRVQEAVQAAGGFTSNANPQALNLAAFVQDGEQLHVPEILAASSNGGGSPSPPSAAGGLVNLNTASQAELESLPHIGPALAERIIAFRQAHGAFEGVDELLGVDGIGAKILDEIKDLVTAGTP